MVQNSYTYHPLEYGGLKSEVRWEFYC